MFRNGFKPAIVMTGKSFVWNASTCRDLFVLNVWLICFTTRSPAGKLTFSSRQDWHIVNIHVTSFWKNTKAYRPCTCYFLICPFWPEPILCCRYISIHYCRWSCSIIKFYIGSLTLTATVFTQQPLTRINDVILFTAIIHLRHTWEANFTCKYTYDIHGKPIHMQMNI